MKYGLFITRCQPLHNGHTHIIEQIIAKGYEVILCIGSANFERTKKNPFTKAERIEMAKRVYGHMPNVHIVAVDDVVQGELYAETVKKAVLEQAKIDVTPIETAIMTCKDGRSDIYVEEAFHPMKCREANSLGVEFKVERLEKLPKFPNCEKIVELIFLKNELWVEKVPAPVADYIKSIMPDLEAPFKRLYGVKYLNPIPTSDLIIEQKTKDGRDGIVLIERINHPIGHALPGGFVEYGEDIYESARREGMEETNLDITELKIMNVYGRPERDSRDHVQTTAFVVPLEASFGELCGGDDAANAHVFALDEIPNDLVFDHQIIVNDYLRWKKSGIPLFFGKKFDKESEYCK